MALSGLPPTAPPLPPGSGVAGRWWAPIRVLSSGASTDFATLARAVRVQINEVARPTHLGESSYGVQPLPHSPSPIAVSRLGDQRPDVVDLAFGTQASRVRRFDQLRAMLTGVYGRHSACLDPTPSGDSGVEPAERSACVRDPCRWTTCLPQCRRSGLLAYSMSPGRRSVPVSARWRSTHPAKPQSGRCCLSRRAREER
jgi:hypothetical protein